MEFAVVRQGVAKVEIEVDHRGLGLPREPRKLGDQFSRRVVRQRRRPVRWGGVVRSIPSRDRGVVDINKHDPVRVREQTDVRRADHVVEMVLFDDQVAKGGEIERPQNVCEPADQQRDRQARCARPPGSRVCRRLPGFLHHPSRRRSLVCRWGMNGSANSALPEAGSEGAAVNSSTSRARRDRYGLPAQGWSEFQARSRSRRNRLEILGDETSYLFRQLRVTRSRVIEQPRLHQVMTNKSLERL